MILRDFMLSLDTAFFSGLTIHRWEKVFKNRPSEICGRQPLKNLKGYKFLKQISIGPFLCFVLDVPKSSGSILENEELWSGGIFIHFWPVIPFYIP